MLRRLLAFALALVFLAPLASAFSSNHDEVHIRFDQNHAPVLLAAGNVEGAGFARDGLLSAFVSNASVGPVPQLHVFDARGALPLEYTIPDATLLVQDGHLAWQFKNASASVNASSSYAFGLALPKSPFGDDSPGLIMAGPEVVAGLSWTRGTAQIIPVNATVTVLDAKGKVAHGFDHVKLNKQADARAQGAPSSGVAFEATGAFVARLPARALAVGLDAKNATMRIDVRASSEDRFLDAAQAVTDAQAVFSQDSNSSGQSSQALQQLGALSGFFNGAILILQQPGENATSTAPLEMKLGDRVVEPGPFTLLRSQDLALAWGGGSLGIQGHTSVAVTQQGFSVQPPLVLGPIPLFSLLLWLVAIGAVVVFFVKRPPAAKGKWSIRGISWLVYAVVLAGVFWWWDKSFAETFGTSLLTLVKAKGLSGDAFSQFAFVFGIEMIPWSLAALLFALPVRIGLGVLLRYRGQGSSYKGIAKAGGLIALAILGPIYALWIANVLIGQVVKYAPKMFG